MKLTVASSLIASIIAGLAMTSVAHANDAEGAFVGGGAGWSRAQNLTDLSNSGVERDTYAVEIPLHKCRGDLEQGCNVDARRTTSRAPCSQGITIGSGRRRLASCQRRYRRVAAGRLRLASGWRQM